MNGELFTIEDARSGFLMVRLDTLAAARERLTGAHRAEALGTLVALTAIAHAQGNDTPRQHLQMAEKSTAQAAADRPADLCGHLRMSKTLVSRTLGHLEEVGAITRQPSTILDGVRVPSTIELTGRLAPFARVDCAAYAAITRTAGRSLIRHLAVYVTLIEQAGLRYDQFPDENRKVAHLSLGQLSKLSGCSERLCHDVIRTLLAAEVLRVERPVSKSGMTLPVRYILTDAPRFQGVAPDGPKARATWTEGSHDLDRSLAPAGPKGRSAWTEGSHDLDRRVAACDPNARTRDVQTEQTTDHPLSDHTAQEHTDPVAKGDVDPVEQLLSAFVQRLGSEGSPQRARRLYAENRDAWQRAAHELLEDFDLALLLAAVEFAPTCPYSGPRTCHLPGFAKHIDEVLRRMRTNPLTLTSPTPAPTTFDIAEADALIVRAIRRFGRTGSEAIPWLRDHHAAVADAAAAITWAVLCQADDTTRRIALAQHAKTLTTKDRAA